MSNQIPQDIGEYLSYDAPSGVLTWIQRTGKRVKIGDVVKTVGSTGRLQVKFRRVLYLAHRVAWFLHTGEQPSEFIDHRDCNPLNNTFTNLRAATLSQNSHNQGKRLANTSGYKRVSWSKKSRRWVAFITVGGKQKYLGSFSNPEEAHEMYCKAADELHKEFKNYGLVET